MSASFSGGSLIPLRGEGVELALVVCMLALVVGLAAEKWLPTDVNPANLKVMGVSSHAHNARKYL
jgi:hypothetical protein